MTIKEDGVQLPGRTILNFGSGITAVDNPTDSQIDITVDPAEIGDIPVDGGENVPSLRTLGLAELSALSATIADTRYASLALTDALQAQIDALTPGGGEAGSSVGIPIQNFGAVADGRIVPGGSMTAGSNVVTCPLANFTSADIGKRIAVCSTGTATVGGISGPGGSSAGGTIVGYISTVPSSSTVTIVTTPGGSTPKNASFSASNKTVIFGTDNTGAIQAAVDSLPGDGISVKPGGLLYAPQGIYVTVEVITWRTGVSLLGDGPGCTVFCPTGDHTQFMTKPTAATFTNPYRDVSLRQFEVDCRGMISTTGYAPQNGKCFDMYYGARVLVQDVYAHDSLATCFAFDHAQEQFVISRCFALRAGRLNDGTGFGGSGFGMGTNGSSDTEPAVITNCHGVDCGRYGAFLEVQSTGSSAESGQSVGWQISNNFFRGNTSGIGDCGSRWTRIIGNYCADNRTAGIEVSHGTTTSGRPGWQNLIANNVCVRNAVGILIEPIMTTPASARGLMQITGNLVAFNTAQGIKLNMLDRDLRSMEITNNSIQNNGRSGIRALYQGGPAVLTAWNGATAYSVGDIVYYRNTSTGLALAYQRLIAGTTGTAPDSDGTNWSVLGALRDSDISGNRVFNNGTAHVAGDEDGMRFAVAVVRTNLDRNTCADRDSATAQKYGLVFDGPMTAGSLSYNRLRGNLTGGWSFTNTAFRDDTATIFSGNSGTASGGSALNPAPVAETPGASPWTRTAAKRPETLHISGGTVSSVTIGGVQVAASTGVMIPLEEGDAPVITYSSAPTVAVRAR